ncbi:hypothetical protein MMC25_000368 [Agyrium rufum]|nr:hypothetical protein [Agyrium rufum]
MDSIKSDTSEPKKETPLPGTKPAWYQPDIEIIPASAKDLLEKYSSIPEDELKEHVMKVREKAWSIAPYPCIGSWLFLKQSINQTAFYQEILTRLKNGEKLLDLGCALGQDIRRLVYDGAPSENIYGLDLSGGLIDAGYDLFLDKDTLRSKFITADILKDSAPTEALEDQIDLVFASSFFHVFDWDQQMIISKRLVGFLRKKPGSEIFGHHLGHISPDSYPLGLQAGNVYGHDASSLQRMWDRVGKETGSSWKVEATLESTGAPVGFTKEGKWGDPGRQFMKFAVIRQD